VSDDNALSARKDCLQLLAAHADGADGAGPDVADDDAQAHGRRNERKRVVEAETVALELRQAGVNSGPAGAALLDVVDVDH
jgi:hypothetical protein